MRTGPNAADWVEWGRESMMSQQQTKTVNALDKVDPVWARIRREAEVVVRQEPELSSFIYSSVLHHDRLEQVVVHRIAERLDHADVSGELIRQAYQDALDDTPGMGDMFRADVLATYAPHPATNRFSEPVLYYKGFHAIQTHRLAHWLWAKGRKDFAYYLQSRASAVLNCDIHPAARIGRGIFLDHASGLVVGETAAIADDVSMLHSVTLGGTGKEDGDRHPKIGRSEEHTSELQSLRHLVCRLLLEKKKKKQEKEKKKKKKIIKRNRHHRSVRYKPQRSTMTHTYYVTSLQSQ